MNVNSAQMPDLLNSAQVEKIKSAKEGGDLQKSCEDFEGVLLNYMFQSMKKTVGDSGLFEESFQRGMYESLFLENISQKIAEERGMGLGDSLYRQLSAGGEKNSDDDGVEASEDKKAV